MMLVISNRIFRLAKLPIILKFLRQSDFYLDYRRCNPAIPLAGKGIRIVLRSLFAHVASIDVASGIYP
jgi:hypothetical protein